MKRAQNCGAKFHYEAQNQNGPPKSAGVAVHDMKMSAGVKIRAQNWSAKGPKGEKGAKKVHTFSTMRHKMEKGRPKTAARAVHVMQNHAVATYSGYFTSVASEMSRWRR